MTRLSTRTRNALPFFVLLLEVLIFYRDILRGALLLPWDIRTYHLPQALFVAKSLRAGELPLWNPYIYCGHPFAANIQTALFYPPRLLATLLGGVEARTMLYSLQLELISHVLLAGLFAYLLLHELRLPRAVALAGATSFQLGAFFASQAEHLGAIECAAWLPALWLLILRCGSGFPARLGLRMKPALLLSAVMSFTLLSGFTPLTTVSLLSSGALVVLLIAGGKARPQLAAGFCACFAASLVLSAIVFLPAAQLTLLSVSRYRADWIGNVGGLPLRSLYSLFWPNSFHVLERGAYRGPTDITLMYLYSGMVMLFGAVVLSMRRRFTLFAALFAVCLLFLLGASTPFGNLYSRLVPAALRGILYPQEWLAPLSLALCIWGSQGLATLRAPAFVQAFFVIACAADLTWAGSSRPFNSTSPITEPGITETAFLGSSELLDTVKKFTHLTNPPSRIDTAEDSLDWVGSAMITGIPTAGGEDPLALVRYIQARLAFTKGERWGYYYQAQDLNSAILPSLNVCCILSRSKPSANPGASQYPNALAVPGRTLYFTGSALPRFHLVYQTRPAATMEEAAVMAKGAWDPRVIAIVERHPAFLAPIDPASKVRMIEYRNNSVHLETASTSAGFLVSSEADYPGWSATVDGASTPVYLTNVAFRGIFVPPGRHAVAFHFRPWLQGFAALVSAAAWAFWLSCWLRLGKGLSFAYHSDEGVPR